MRPLPSASGIADEIISFLSDIAWYDFHVNMYGAVVDIKSHREPDIAIMDKLLVDQLLPKMFNSSGKFGNDDQYLSLLFHSNVLVAESAIGDVIKGFYINPKIQSKKQDCKLAGSSRVATPAEVLLWLSVAAKTKVKNDYIYPQKKEYEAWLKERKPMVDAKGGVIKDEAGNSIWQPEKQFTLLAKYRRPGYVDMLPDCDI